VLGKKQEVSAVLSPHWELSGPALIQWPVPHYCHHLPGLAPGLKAAVRIWPEAVVPGGKTASAAPHLEKGQERLQAAWEMNRSRLHVVHELSLILAVLRYLLLESCFALKGQQQVAPYYLKKYGEQWSLFW
jgi:hypothetical protein